MAVISTASGPAWRKGLYASPSMRMPSAVQTATAAMTDTIAGSPMYEVTTNEI